MFLKYKNMLPINVDKIITILKSDKIDLENFFPKAGIYFQIGDCPEIIWEISDPVELEAVYQSILSVIETKDIENFISYYYAAETEKGELTNEDKKSTP